MDTKDILVISIGALFIWGIVLYTIIKAAVKNGILEAKKITDKIYISQGK
jgi:hypothetical protein